MKTNKTTCGECTYFHGKDGVNCSPHPSGPLDDSCRDFQSKLKSSNQMRNLISNLIFLLLIAILLGIPVKLFQEVFWTQKMIDKNSAAASQYENEFRQNASQFIENAGNAGTTRIAQTELAKSMSWLENKYPEDRFEYKDLKANLKFLERLQSESVLPLSLKQSINKDLELIKNTVDEKAANIYEQGNSNLYRWYRIESLGFLISCGIACLIVIAITKELINYFEKD